MIHEHDRLALIMKILFHVRHGLNLTQNHSSKNRLATSERKKISNAFNYSHDYAAYVIIVPTGYLFHCFISFVFGRYVLFCAVFP